jgi:hypothetical protein
VLPDRVFARAILVRAAVVWVLAHVIGVAAPWLARGMAERFEPGVTHGSALWIVLVVVTICLLDARRRGERLFLANLGVPERGIALLAALPAIAGELLVGMFAA